MKKNIIVCLLFLPILLLAAFCYETNPFTDSAFGDPTWFAYIARMWLKGHVPFLEYFDHKGPMIFFLNMLGLAITDSTYIGIWLIEMLFLAFSIKVVYSYVNEFCGKIEAVVTAAFVTACMLKLTSPCDSIESFAYPIVTYCLIRFVTILKRGSHVTRFDAFAFGLAFMGLFLLKANLVSVAFVIAAFYLQDWYQSREPKRFFVNSGLTFLGMLTLFVPFVTYFYCKDALYDLWYCAIEYNLSYASNTATFNKLLWAVLALNIINLAMMAMHSFDRKVLAYNQLFLFITGLTLWQCPTYDHYYVLIVPGLVPMMVEAFGAMKNMIWIKLAILTFLYCFSGCVLGIKVLTTNLDVSGYLNNLKGGGTLASIVDYKEGQQFFETHKFLDLIENKNSVLCFGRFGLYEYLKVTTKFKYFLHTTGELAEHIREASKNNLKSRNDRYVIAYKEDVAGEWQTILADGYKLLDESENFLLFERKDF